ncbi:hypothetical protein [Ancylobacter aquaticus]|uniref:hypothetical protein n=1 Tax=Ancylobacter aquaticus TaxID=100 RepID=UPI001404C38B|nr:hypothetical protein [Ancylobacter aquaticus]
MVERPEGPRYPEADQIVRMRSTAGFEPEMNVMFMSVSPAQGSAYGVMKSEWALGDLVTASMKQNVAAAGVRDRVRCARRRFRRSIRCWFRPSSTW